MVKQVLFILFCSLFFIGYSQLNTDSSLYADGHLKSKVIHHSSYSECLFYYPGGILNVREEIRMDQVDGIRTTYYKSGSEKSVETYKMGALHGKSSYFFESGTLKRRGDYFEDLYSGVWSMYHDSKDTLLKSIGGYTDGKPDGEWIFCGLHKDQVYVSHKGGYVDGLKESVWFGYYSSGELKSRTNYESGILQGNYTGYNKRSRVLSNGSYDNGTPKGGWVVRSLIGLYRLKQY